jgi:serine/threonine protein kinase
MIMLGKTLTGRYKIVEQLGGGGFSQTFIAEDAHLPDHPRCVIKHLKPASTEEEILKISRELFDREAKVLYRLGRHDCIPSLLAHFEEDAEFFLAQELIEGDILNKELKREHCLGEQYTIDFLTDILPTLDFVHCQQVIHRDIKPSNLIRRASDRKIVLIDFGAVKEVSTQPLSQLGSQLGREQTSSLVIGSPGYMPNEQYSGKTMFASDIYAVGIIAVQALTGLGPNQIPEDPRTSEFCWRDRIQVTPTLADVIDKMVRYDFRQRYQSATEVLEALQPLLMRSLGQTVFSGIASSAPEDEELSQELLAMAQSAKRIASPVPEEDEELSQELLAMAQSAKSIAKSTVEIPVKSAIELLFEGISDDFEMSEDPVRAKKLVCLVCTGILENDLQRLNNFSFVELLQDLYQQHPTIEALKENLVKAVKTIAPQKQRQYLIVAKLVFNIVSKLYEKLATPAIAEPVISSPISSQVEPIPPQISYSVENLVINAGSAQLIAPINNISQEVLPSTEPEPTQQPERELDIYDWVADEINADSQQVRLKKLLFYTCQDIWESDVEQLNSINWVGLLRELVSFMPTFPQLMALLQESVQRVSKPAEYLPIGNLLLSKLQHLYPDGFDAIAPSSSPSSNHQLLDHKLLNNQVKLNNQVNRSSSRSDIPEKSKTPFDPKITSNLFDLRLELMRFTNSMRAKILLFSVLYYPFNPDRDNWQDLRSHGLDELLRRLFYVYPSFAEADNAIWQMSRSLSEPSAYEQSANYILQAIKTLYDQLESRSMCHPSEQGSLSFDNIDNVDLTQGNTFPNTSDDDETCQFM